MTQATGEIADIDAAQTARLNDALSYFGGGTGASQVAGMTLMQSLTLDGSVNMVINTGANDWLFGFEFSRADGTSMATYLDSTLAKTVKPIARIEFSNGAVHYVPIEKAYDYSNQARFSYDVYTTWGSGSGLPEAAAFDNTVRTSTATSISFYE
jgi:hypothetical protein